MCISLFSCVGIEVNPDNPNEYLIKGVKHIQQGHMQCGAASLKMVLNYYDKEIGLNELYQKIKGRRAGVPTYSMERYTNTHYDNLDTLSFVSSNYKIWKKFIKRDIPLIARGKSYGLDADCHYVVIVGYKKEGFIIDDPQHGLAYMNFKMFKKWHNCIHSPKWLMAIYPSEEASNIPSPYFD